MSNSESTKWRNGLTIGQKVKCEVYSHQIFGVFVRLPAGQCGIIERIQMARDGYVSPRDYPALGSTVELEIIDFRENSQQVDVKLPSLGQSDGAIVEKTIEAGLRLMPDGQLSFYGFDEINEAIFEGLVVQSMKPVNVIAGKSIGSIESNSVKVVVRGVSFSVLLRKSLS